MEELFSISRFGLTSRALNNVASQLVFSIPTVCSKTERAQNGAFPAPGLAEGVRMTAGKDNHHQRLEGDKAGITYGACMQPLPLTSQMVCIFV